MPRKPILSLDFDGVLHSYTSKWGAADIIPDPPVPGAVAFILEAVKHFDVQVFSTRSHQEGGIDAMREYLALAGIDRVVLAELKFPVTKPPAHVTLDDRAITFTGNWPSMEQLLAFKPWNKR